MHLLPRSRLAFILGRGFAHPAAKLGLSTLCVFAVALASGWSWATTVGDVCMNSTAGLCVIPGGNPCSAVTCAPTGAGYQCQLDSGVEQTERNYKLTIPAALTSLPNCRTGKSGQSCGATWQPCGTTYHYPVPDTHCSVTCLGTWLWLACQASGDACTN